MAIDRGSRAREKPEHPQGKGQADWRFCRKCNVLFFDGSPKKGVCPADDGNHEASGYNFVLYHNRQPTVREEGNWHFCGKCQALFSATSGAVSFCPADAQHHAGIGYTFVVGQKGGTID